MKRLSKERFEKCKLYFSNKDEYKLENIVIRNGLDKNYRKEGNTLYISCPFHADRTPSCSVDYEGNRYKCFSCGNGGNGLNLQYGLEKMNEGKEFTYPHFINQLLRFDTEAHRDLGFTSIYKTLELYEVNDKNIKGDNTCEQSSNIEVKLNIRKPKIRRASDNRCVSSAISTYNDIVNIISVKNANIDTKMFIAESIQEELDVESLYKILIACDFNILNKKSQIIAGPSRLGSLDINEFLTSD